MKKVLVFALFVFFLIGCSGVKRAEQALNSGNFDTAINTAVQNLRTDRNSKRKQDYVLLLEEAFAKAVKEDKISLKRLKADPNPEALEAIYQTYVNLENRQAKIRPLLPLYLIEKERNAKFEMKDYSLNIINSREALSSYLLEKSRQELLNANTLQAREVYADLEYINKINPNYRDVQSLLQQALEMGTDYIIVDVTNDTGMVIPKRLKDELLSFSTYRLNDQWRVYHVNRQENLSYDYELNLSFQNIVITPDQVLQRELQRERAIKDGFVYELDSNGNVKKDSLGNDIKRDKFVTVRATVFQSTQQKEATLDATVLVHDLRTNQMIDRFPIQSSFVFNYIYGRVDGDRRALKEAYLETLNPVAVPFPTDEQMIYDAGEDLKVQLKSILTGLRLNR
jgi:hypothetical protein